MTEIEILKLFISGFLNTNTAPHQHPAMANYGLMDQIAALKWIQQNIQHFGGDAESVTMFGHRNGAACIHFLMQSPAAVAGQYGTVGESSVVLLFTINKSLQD